MKSLDAFARAYIACALWSSTDNSTPQGGEPLDHNYDIDDLAPETLARMQADCDAFRTDEKTTEFIAAGRAMAKRPGCTDEEYAGHDFWLTRNGHGCGFWDGDWPDEAGKYLTDRAHSFGECDLYIGDDRRIYA